MKQELVIKKWGGENAAELEKSPKNIVEDFNSGIQNQLVVVSAIRSPEFNTTDNLIELANLLNGRNKEDIFKKIKEIKSFHINIIKEKIGENNDLIEKVNKYFEENLIKKVEYFLEKENNEIKPNKENDYSINNGEKNFSIIGFGEDLSAFIQSEVINNLNIEGLETKVVDLDGITDNLEGIETDIVKNLAKEMKTRVLVVLDDGKIPVVSGYIPGFEGGIENKIGRGYTDANAAILSIGFSKNYKKVGLEIQKSVEGMLSCDPRILEDGQEAKLIKKMDYLTAKEITGVRGSQAKLLHSQVLKKELLTAGVEVKLFNPFTNSKGTIISKNKNPEASGVEYIGARDNVIFFSISSWDMSDFGILASIFEIVKEYGISVDIVSTSETEISFTIDNNIDNKILNSLSDNIRKKLKIEENDNINFVKYERYKALVFCVGQNLKKEIGALDKATKVLKEKGINIQLMSQGAMERAMIFGIDSKDMEKSVNTLHKEFIK